MYSKIQTLIAWCFYYSGLVGLARWWKEYQGQQTLIILGYHLASGGDLRRHLLYLRRYYRLLHLEDGLNELYAPSINRQRKDDRHLPVALTFDDGYRDNYTYGVTLAREMGIPFTIFLVPGYIEKGNRFWWQENEYLVSHAQVDKVDVQGCAYHLSNMVERNTLAQVIDTHVRYASSVKEREKFLICMRKVLATPYAVTLKEAAVLPLTWEEVQAMQESGQVSFGAHTMHHPILSYLTDFTEVEYEVNICRRQLEQHLGYPLRSFAYPVGQPEHIGEYSPYAVQKAGYDWAVTTIYGFNTPQTNPYLLRRIVVDVDQHWLLIAAKASGVWGFFSRLFWMPVNPIRKLLRYPPVVR